MNNEYIENTKHTIGRIEIAASKEAACIEYGDETLHLYTAADIKNLRSALYDIQCWWESLENQEPEDEI